MTPRKENGKSSVPTDLSSSTEAAHSRYDGLDAWPLERTLEALVASNAEAVTAVQRALPDLTRAAEGIERALVAGGRLVYIGAGTSGRLSLQDAAELPPTFGFHKALTVQAGGDAASAQALEDAEDDENASRTRLEALRLTPNDAVIGIAASGTTPFTVAGVAHAREQGAFTVGIANNPDTPLLQAAEVGVLLATPPEVLAGSTRLAAGTAQKVALNALSTAVLVRLGGAYNNLMVGMNPQNHKLRGRAVRMVVQATGCTPEEASSTLAKSGGIREAIVMLLTGCDAATAKARLEKHHNRIRESIHDRP